MIYELRIYHMFQGKMADINARFCDHTFRLFEKHGIKVTDFWVDDDDNERLYYVCEFADKQAKDAAWTSFRCDNEWQSILAQEVLVEKVESYTMKQAPYFMQNSDTAHA